MRKCVFTPPFLTDSEFLKWQDEVEKEIKNIVEAIKHKKKIPPLKEHLWQTFKKKFLLPVNKGRCEYCEGIYIAGSFADAEHFAPKGKVTQNRKDVKHPGYYWLAYVWQNLLLSCKKCNSKHPDLDNKGSHPGKLNEFPIRKKRLSQPNIDSSKWWEELLAEDPLLFHPYYDDPNKHFKAHKQGYLYGKTKKGKITIEVCHLNRPELREARQTAEELADGRAVKLIVLMATSKDSNPEWFTRSEVFSTYLNCILRKKLEEKAKQISDKANENK